MALTTPEQLSEMTDSELYHHAQWVILDSDSIPTELSQELNQIHTEMMARIEAAQKRTRELYRKAVLQ